MNRNSYSAAQFSNMAANSEASDINNAVNDYAYTSNGGYTRQPWRYMQRGYYSGRYSDNSRMGGYGRSHKGCCCCDKGGGLLDGLLGGLGGGGNGNLGLLAAGAGAFFILYQAITMGRRKRKKRFDNYGSWQGMQDFLLKGRIEPFSFLIHCSIN